MRGTDSHPVRKSPFQSASAPSAGNRLVDQHFVSSDMGFIPACGEQIHIEVIIMRFADQQLHPRVRGTDGKFRDVKRIPRWAHPRLRGTDELFIHFLSPLLASSPFTGNRRLCSLSTRIPCSFIPAYGEQTKRNKDVAHDR